MCCILLWQPSDLVDLLLNILERNWILDQVVVVFDELAVDWIVEWPAGWNGAQLLDDLAEDEGESDHVVFIEERIDRLLQFHQLLLLFGQFLYAFVQHEFGRLRQDGLRNG